jgi:hypothetical protein
VDQCAGEEIDGFGPSLVVVQWLPVGGPEMVIKITVETRNPNLGAASAPPLNKLHPAALTQTSFSSLGN